MGKNPSNRLSGQFTRIAVNCAVFMSFIRKPDTDDREFEHMVLPNGLEALVISDPHTDESCCALDVHVGHFSDPNDIPGLAHFLEHLLFMGTAKYPVENSYSQFLSEHGGTSNAFTGNENTNFYFNVHSDHLFGALDRFAQFFISPLFLETCTMREMHAVDSEHKKNLQSDNWRFYQLQKDLADPTHPFSKFGTGNIDTLLHSPAKLGLNVRDVLIEFYGNYYSANIMKVVCLGKGLFV
jgi:insulysin